MVVFAMLGQSVDFLMNEYICIVSIFGENLDLDVLAIFISIKGHTQDKDIVLVFG